MEVKIKRLHPAAKIPSYGSDGAACFDLHALLEGNDAWAQINKGTPTTFHTGLAFEIPAGHVMLVFSRSGHGFGKNVRLSNCVGVIDSDYRGEVMVKLARDEHDGGDMVVRHGDRIAQAIVLPFPAVRFTEVEDLSDTVRGTNGFGSTGA